MKFNPILIWTAVLLGIMPVSFFVGGILDSFLPYKTASFCSALFATGAMALLGLVSLARMHDADTTKNLRNALVRTKYGIVNGALLLVGLLGTVVLIVGKLLK